MNISGDPYVTTDCRTFADPYPTQQSGIGIDGYVVFQDRVTGYAADSIPVFVGGQFLSGKADALEDTYAVPDDTGFAYYGSCSVVDREIVSDLSSWMDVDTCLGMSHFGDHTGDERDMELIELVCDTVVADGTEPGIAEYHFTDVLCGGIAVVGGFGIGSEQASHLRKGCDECFGKCFCAGLYFFFQAGSTAGIGQAKSGIDLPAE